MDDFADENHEITFSQYFRLQCGLFDHHKFTEFIVPQYRIYSSRVSFMQLVFDDNNQSHAGLTILQRFQMILQAL